STTNISCPGANDGSVRFTVTPGPYTWQWIDDPSQTSSTLTGLGPGAYTVLVSGGTCPSWISGFLGDPAITILGNASYCATDPPLLTVDPQWGFTPDVYEWSTGENTSSIQIEAGTEGPIQLTATNTALGCMLSAQIDLTQRVGPTVAFSAPDTLCLRVPGVAVTTSGAALLHWQWGGGDTSSLAQPSISFDRPYWQPVSLQGFDLDGCGGEPALDSVYVRPRIAADFMAAQVPCTSLIDLRFNSNSDSCAFFIGDSLVLDLCYGALRLDMRRYQIYDLTFYSTQPNRCDDTSMVSIDMIAEPILFLPNAFTPDGDHINDEWPGPVEIPEEGYELQVFDRWGHAHWRTTDIHERWTGASLPAGVYVYTMRMRDPCEPTKEIARKGTVSLIR
ncbi:MAG: gliding motility-associated C-terminal domain-containing protein, partial [Flavobacteriales bacterium]|nr:gliding motility-associated C-terminal domain-containing protein [Flavobacteriales bacterium]